MSHLAPGRSSRTLTFAAPAHPCAMAALGLPALRCTCTSMCNGISPATDAGLILTTFATQKNHREGGLFVWWRRRESNPRPQVIRFRLYMLIRLLF